eukprot:TRINITY_DN23022_c0_g1_i1.p1 TRINITY_DN23022_c0_g1~~TRINITY_DN23022_c0_g1_i1.p1  ORF type:complete len:291 (-),score=27.80 TRINITY_DN23022_c0_g1_i1:350-1222(-)
MSGPDTLFSLRNNFQLGAYQAAINESSVGGLSEAESIERDTIVYRSYIALGSYQLVIDEITDASATALQAVKQLAVYLADKSKKDSVLSSLEGYLSDSVVGKNPTLLLVAGTVYTHEQNYVDALKVTHAIPGNLELMALNVQIFLKMDRIDFAEKQLKAMQQIDEDATLTQLAQGWVSLALGGSKLQEATYIFQELSDKFSPTVLLLNGSALAQMHMGSYEDAEALLLDALNKDAKDANTLANLVICCLHRGKPSTRYLNQLKNVAPDHVLVERQVALESAFDQAVSAYA